MKFLEEQILPNFEDKLTNDPIKIIESNQYENSIYQIVLKLKTQEYSDKFFSAFNGRYFRDDITLNH